MGVPTNPRCSVNSGLSVEQRLPNELLRQIFLYCDPATLYTSIRPVNRSWKHTVERELIASHFSNKVWRVGLRVVRKLPSSSVQQLSASDDDGQLERLNALQRQGAIEQPIPSSSHPNSIVHVVPLHFQGYDEENVSLKFGTGTDWHALFCVSPKDLEAEDDEEDFGAARARSEAKADSSRLELDFGLVWRFPDDGQDVDPVTTKDGKVDQAASWGSPDPENGWLSRFYCSNYDVKRQDGAESAQASGSRVLRSTPLARRIRQATLYPDLEESLREQQDDASSSDSSSERAGESLVWSDEGHEYMSMDLSLGMEFFVRRSARANQLLRRLEVEAIAAEAREVMQSVKRGKGQGKKRWAGGLNSAVASGWATPNQVASPPPSRTTGAIDSRRRPQLLKLQQSQYSSHQVAHDLNSQDSKKSSAKAKAREAADSSTLLNELDDDELSFVLGEATPAGAATPMSSSMFSASSKLVSRLGSVAPSRRGGGSVALSSTGSTSSRNGSSGRAGAGSTPRATFSAKLCRAEMSPSTAGWVGGDKLGRGSYRYAEARSQEEQDSPMEKVLLRSGVTSPATWSWSR